MNLRLRIVGGIGFALLVVSAWFGALGAPGWIAIAGLLGLVAVIAGVIVTTCNAARNDVSSWSWTLGGLGLALLCTSTWFGALRAQGPRWIAVTGLLGIGATAATVIATRPNRPNPTQPGAPVAGPQRKRPWVADRKDRLLAYLVPLVLFGVGVVTLALYAYDAASVANASKWVAFGLGGLLAVGAFCSGSVLGLLFGIPSPRAGEKSLGASNNLNQVADWLTKVLVGATLTQVTKLPGALRQFASDYGQQIGGSASVFILVGFSASGFFSGYVFTRLVLQHAFYRADGVPKDGGADEREGLDPASANTTQPAVPARGAPPDLNRAEIQATSETSATTTAIQQSPEGKPGGAE